MVYAAAMILGGVIFGLFVYYGYEQGRVVGQRIETNVIDIEVRTESATRRLQALMLQVEDLREQIAYLCDDLERVGLDEQPVDDDDPPADEETTETT